jgi:hypothetical protein
LSRTRYLAVSREKLYEALKEKAIEELPNLEDRKKHDYHGGAKTALDEDYKQILKDIERSKHFTGEKINLDSEVGETAKIMGLAYCLLDPTSGFQQGMGHILTPLAEFTYGKKRGGELNILGLTEYETFWVLAQGIFPGYAPAQSSSSKPKCRRLRQSYYKLKLV